MNNSNMLILGVLWRSDKGCDPRRSSQNGRSPPRSSGWITRRHRVSKKHPSLAPCLHSTWEEAGREAMAVLVTILAICWGSTQVLHQRHRNENIQ